LQDVAFGRDRFVAVQGTAYYSTDQGAPWAAGGTSLSTLKGCVEWDPKAGLFFAGQGYNDTTGAIESSLDGISWIINYTGD
ncbi:hypothetical protein DF186_23110, partial [Enterococcus hirae]